METATLDRVGRNVHRGRNDLQQGWERAEAGDMITARKLLSNANEAIQDAHCTLRSEGVANLDGAPSLSLGDIPLHLLSSAAARRLLDAVDAARLAAYDVDEERGHVVGDGTPCGWGDVLDDLYYRVRAEVQGPKGKD